MKKKMIVGITVAAIIVVGLICFCIWFLSEVGSTYYYAQIDNSKIEQVNSRGGVIDLHGGLSYSYTLPAYNENGDKKDITFGTSRELKEAAFIRLTVMPVRGVLEWSEVQYDELPAAVQSNYAIPANEQCPGADAHGMSGYLEAVETDMVSGDDYFKRVTGGEGIA